MLLSLECVSGPARTKFPLESPYGHHSCFSLGLLVLPEGLLESPLQHSDTGWRSQRTWSGSHGEAFSLESRTWPGPSLAPKLTVCPSTRTKNSRTESRKWLWAAQLSTWNGCMYNIHYESCVSFVIHTMHVVCIFCSTLYMCHVSHTHVYFECELHILCLSCHGCCGTVCVMCGILCNVCCVTHACYIYWLCCMLHVSYCVSHKHAVHVRCALGCVAYIVYTLWVLHISHEKSDVCFVWDEHHMHCVSLICYTYWA